MKFGVFNVPYADPARSPKQVIEWDLELTRWADELGFAEAWFAEHYTIGWEPSPAPDLMIAAALRETTQIQLAPGAHLLPYHHPANLAHRVAWLDHMAEGRYVLGIGAGGFASDMQLFQTTDHNGPMLWEALEIMQRLWTSEVPFEFAGKYWHVSLPEHSELFRGPHLTPFQRPHPPIAIAGSSPRSSTLAKAGANGLEPVSLGLGAEFLGGQWDVYAEAANEAGRTPDRRTWRVARDFFVAETDKEAIDLAVNGRLGAQYREYVIPHFAKSGILGFMAPGLPEDEITPEHLARNGWLCGSPDTVVELIQKMYDDTGGFGTLLLMTCDYIEQSDAYRRCFDLLAEEVLPRVQDLVPAGAA
jgi:alkanesulfonate monooxygenase SsuD/methylene tetrahydromethanopterin reductase-like flavin-dependent oxidoreductase (luciferase family)